MKKREKTRKEIENKIKTKKKVKEGQKIVLQKEREGV